MRMSASGRNIRSAPRVDGLAPLEERTLRFLGILVRGKLATEALLELVAALEIHELDLVQRALGEPDRDRAVAGDLLGPAARLHEELVLRDDRDQRAEPDEV